MRKKSGPPTSTAGGIVQDFRRKTRKQHSAEENIRIVLEGLRGEESIAALCRFEGIAISLCYSWSKEFMEAALLALPDRIAAAGAACLMAQNVRGERLVPREIMDVCHALKLHDREDIAPVLALLGWVFAPSTRRNRHVFWDLFSMPGTVKYLMPAMDMNQALALGITRTMLKERLLQETK